MAFSNKQLKPFCSPGILNGRSFRIKDCIHPIPNLDIEQEPSNISLMPKTKKEAIPLKSCDFSMVFLFHFGHLQISMAWNHLNVTISPGACAKGLARSWPTCFHRRSSKRWWFLGCRFPRWWVNWVTCPKLQVFREKKHVKHGSSPSK